MHVDTIRSTVASRRNRAVAYSIVGSAAFLLGFLLANGSAELVEFGASSTVGSTVATVLLVACAGEVTYAFAKHGVDWN